MQTLRERIERDGLDGLDAETIDGLVEQAISFRWMNTREQRRRLASPGWETELAEDDELCSLVEALLPAETREREWAFVLIESAFDDETEREAVALLADNDPPAEPHEDERRLRSLLGWDGVDADDDSADE